MVSQDWKKRYKTSDESFQAALDLLLEDSNAIERKTMVRYLTDLQERVAPNRNPYINVQQSVDFGPNRASAKRASPQANWSSTPDTINVFSNRILEDLIAEYPHIEQYEEFRERKMPGKLLNMVTESVNELFLRDMPKLLGYGEPIYEWPKTHEYDAHSVREPKLRQEYDELYQSNLDSYLVDKYGMTSEQAFAEIRMPEEERVSDPNILRDELNEIGELYNKRAGLSKEKQIDVWNSRNLGGVPVELQRKRWNWGDDENTNK
jgi:hypothetical protein